MYRLIGGKKFSFRKLTKFALQNGFSGTGTEGDPLVIKNYIFESEYLILKKLSQSIIFEDCKFEYLKVKRCKNLKFNTCESGTMEFANSNNCITDHSKILHVVRLRRCTNILIKNSSLTLLDLIYSHFNTISKSTIYHVANLYSGGNTFEDNIEMGRSLKASLEILPKRKLLKNIIFYPSVVSIILLSIVIFFTVISSDLHPFPKILFIAFSLFFITCITYVIINNHYHYITSLKAGNNNVK